MRLGKFIVGIAAATTLAACNTLTPEERIELAKRVNRQLDSRHYTIDVRTIIPRMGQTNDFTGNWSLEVRGDTLSSYLPYIGRSYSIPYGRGIGLDFDAPIDSYQETTGKHQERIIKLAVTNEEDSYVYTIEVSDDGSASIDVTAVKRDGISFLGELETEPDRK